MTISNLYPDIVLKVGELYLVENFNLDFDRKSHNYCVEQTNIKKHFSFKSLTSIKLRGKAN